MIMTADDMQRKLASRLVVLLRESPDQQEDMSRVYQLLSEADLLPTAPDMDSPEEFAQEAIGDNRALRKIVARAAALEMDPDSAQNAEDLVLRLLPSDSHLD